MLKGKYSSTVNEGEESPALPGRRQLPGYQGPNSCNSRLFDSRRSAGQSRSPLEHNTPSRAVAPWSRLELFFVWHRELCRNDQFEPLRSSTFMIVQNTSLAAVGHQICSCSACVVAFSSSFGVSYLRGPFPATTYVIVGRVTVPPKCSSSFPAPRVSSDHQTPTETTDNQGFCFGLSAFCNHHKRNERIAELHVYCVRIFESVDRA